MTRIAELRQLHSKAVPNLQKQQDVAEGRLTLARKAFEDASLAFNQAAGAVVSASFAHDSAVGKLERNLRDTADPMIHEFVREMDALHERERREKPETTEQRYSRAGFDRVLVTTERPSRLRRLSSIVAVEREARDSPENLARRLKGLGNNPSDYHGVAAGRRPLMFASEIDLGGFRTRPSRLAPASRASRRETRPSRIVGIAVPFGEFSAPILGEARHPYREMIINGAFRESIRSDPVVFVISHRADEPCAGRVLPDDLASTREGTLKLFEDGRGLRFELLRGRGDAYLIDRIAQKAFAGASIRFESEEEEWESGPGGFIRIIHKGKLLHIAAAARPAYAGTSIAVID